MITIALLVPVCSRRQHYNTIEETPLIQYLLPSFLKTRDIEYKYKIFLGYDSTDEYYCNNIDEIIKMCSSMWWQDIVAIKLEGCEHKPAKAWNDLFEVAISEDFDYYYQIGDDVVMETPWTSKFVEVLQKHDNIGVVGGCHKRNYDLRLQRYMPPVIENAFLHKTHYHIFGILFDKRIENWFCDDWLTGIYKPDYSHHLLDVHVTNKVIDGRYNVRCIFGKIGDLIEEGQKIFEQHKSEPSLQQT